MIPHDKLYIATIAEDAEDLARAHGLGIELDDFCTAANMDGDAFAQWDATARQHLAASDRHILHGPFAELFPAAVDPLAREVAMRRFRQAAALAQGYGIRRMVVHAGFIPQVYFPEWFVAQSAVFWREFLSEMPDDFSLLIENVLEDDPRMLADMLAAIGDPRAQACLDIGHAYLQSSHALTDWIDALAPYLGHVHLHNNDGTRDAHAGLCEGVLPMREIIARLLEAAPMATYSLEVRQGQASLDALDAWGRERTEDAPRATLRQVFGYDDFREGQRSLIDAQLAGRDALGIMPTGSGKSVCFQIPALLLDGVTLVISPLISLMKDQVAALGQSGVRAAYLNSSLTERQMTAALRNAEAGAYRLIYVAPERLLTERFLSFARQANIALVAVDEAHCISQWGQDFRPSYLDIPAFVAQLPRRPAVSAFTATATPQVREDIVRMLGLRDAAVVQTGFDRPNLRLRVERPRQKRDALMALMAGRRGESGIIYCATRKAVEEVCDMLRAAGVAATRYHAGLSDDERRQNQEDFSFDRCPVVVATNAFGMGIDKSNVRYVIHYNMPKDLESYYQEAGRAGRDGDPADCVLLYSGQDVATQKFLIDKQGDDETADPRLLAEVREKAMGRLGEMVRYCRTHECLRQFILGYFGEAMAAHCGNCGSCEAAVSTTDMTDVALPILRAVSRYEGRFGLGVLLEMLRGRATKRVKQYRLDRDDAFGALETMSGDALAAIGEAMLAEGYLDTLDGKYPVASLGPMAEEAFAGAPVLLRVRPAEPSVPRARRRARDYDLPDLAAGSSAPRQRRGNNDLPEIDDIKALLGKAAPRETIPDADDALFEVLRVARMRLATQLGVPAFVVFSDTTLRDMSAQKPRTRPDMLRVKGVGEAKLQQYGDLFLREIDAYLRRAEADE